jgi:hypothetical protein
MTLLQFQLSLSKVAQEPDHSDSDSDSDSASVQFLFSGQELPPKVFEFPLQQIPVLKLHLQDLNVCQELDDFVL